jgi:quercetin dioxygenase-like cupin family protein
MHHVITSTKLAILVTLALSTSCARPGTGSPPSSAAAQHGRVPFVVNVATVSAPEDSRIVHHDAVVLPHSATRIMRLGAGATIAQHHHAGYDETFIVQRGSISLRLDGRPQNVHEGDVVLIPAGTTIEGINGGSESLVIVVWSNTGSGSALTTPGPGPTHHAR